MDELLDRINKKLDKIGSEEYLKEKAYAAEKSLESLKFYVTVLVSLWTFLALIVFTILASTAPVLIQSENMTLLGLGAFIYNLVSVFAMCHQLPMRSLFILDVQQAVCARDLGIYIGAILAGILFLYKKPEFLKTKKFLILSIIPIALDGVTQSILNLRESNNMLRIITGLIFGFGLMFFILARVRTFNSMEFENLLKKKSFIISLCIVFLLSMAMLIQASTLMGREYFSKEDAIRIAVNGTKENIQVFYIAPRTPLTYIFYPSKGYYNDNVLEDVGGMEWIREQMRLMLIQTLPLNETNPFDIQLQDSHFYGIWAVVQLAGKEESLQENTVFTDSKGYYYYIDAKTGEAFEKHEH